MRTREELLLQIAEEEITLAGGKIEWYPVDRPECAGGSIYQPFAVFAEWVAQIPWEVCIDRERFRTWLQGASRRQQQGHRCSSRKHPCKASPQQLPLFDIGL